MKPEQAAKLKELEEKHLAQQARLAEKKRLEEEQARHEEELIRKAYEAMQAYSF